MNYSAIIRPYRDEDGAAVYRIHERAFGGGEEAELVEAIVHDYAAVCSLVAEQEGAVVGHILYTALDIEPAPSPQRRLLALAPLAVLPEYQRQGVGDALTRESLRQLGVADWDGVIVLGHPEYYPRFGFGSASRYGIQFPGEVPAASFMALPLIEGALDGCDGVVRYHPAFGLP